ncbi:thymidylate kinase [groundwater metagenome]
MDKNPFFIVIEGIDGSGKGTQATKLFSEIKEGKFPSLINVAVKKTMEPTNGLIGELIRQFLTDDKFVAKEQLALLFAADRLDNLYKNIKPILNKAGVVISERYVYSTLAYQSCEGIDFDWLCKINKFAIPPDLAILLDVNPSKSLTRFKSDSNNGKRKWEKQEYFEKKLFLLERIRERYLEIFRGEIESERYNFLDTNFVIIDASKDREEVYERIKEHVNALIKGEYPRKSIKQFELEKYTSRTLHDYL